MIKKIATVAATGAAFLSIAGFAMAQRGSHHQRPSSSDVTITNTSTNVIGVSFSSADSGDNQQMSSGQTRSHHGRTGSSTQGIRTGNTVALAGTELFVNETVVSSNCECSGDITIGNHGTNVIGGSIALADSGDNQQRSRGSVRQWTSTGSSRAESGTFAGVNLVKITRR